MKKEKWGKVVKSDTLMWFQRNKRGKWGKQGKNISRKGREGEEVKSEE